MGLPSTGQVASYSALLFGAATIYIFHSYKIEDGEKNGPPWEVLGLSVGWR